MNSVSKRATVRPARTSGKTGITLLGEPRRGSAALVAATTQRAVRAAPSVEDTPETARKKMLAARAAVAAAQLAAAAQIEAGVLECVAALAAAPSAAAEKTLARISEMLRGAPSSGTAPTWSEICAFLAAKETLRKAVALLDPVNCRTGSAAVAAVAAAAAAAAGTPALSHDGSIVTTPSAWTWSSTEQRGWGIELKDSNMMMHLTRTEVNPSHTSASSTTAGARGTDGWTSGTHDWAVEFVGSGTGTHGAVGICTEAKGVLWLAKYSHVLGGPARESWGWHKDGKAMFGDKQIGDLPKYGSGDTLEMHLDCTGASATLSFSKNGTLASSFKFTGIPLDKPLFPAACTPMSSGKIVLLSRADSIPVIAAVAKDEDDTSMEDAHTAAASAVDAEKAAAARLVEDLAPVASLVDLLTAVDMFQELVLTYRADAPRVNIRALRGGLSIASASASSTAPDAASPFAPLALASTGKVAKTWRSAKDVAPVWWEVDFGNHAVPLHMLRVRWSPTARPTDWALCCLHDDGGRFGSILAGAVRAAKETGGANRSGWRVVRRFRNEALRERDVLLLPAARARKLRLVVYASTSSAAVDDARARGADDGSALFSIRREGSASQPQSAAAAATEATAACDASEAEAPWSVGLDAVSIYLAPFSLRGARAEDYQRIPIRSRSERLREYADGEETSSKCSEEAEEEDFSMPRAYEDQVVTLHNFGAAQGGLDALLSGAEHRATRNTLYINEATSNAMLLCADAVDMPEFSGPERKSLSNDFAIERLAPGRNGVPNDEAVWAIDVRNGSETESGFKKLAHYDAESCADSASGMSRGRAAIVEDEGAKSQWQLIPANDSVRTVAPADAPWQFCVKTHLYAGAPFRTAAEDEAAYVEVARLPSLPDFNSLAPTQTHSLPLHRADTSPPHLQVQARARRRHGSAPARRGRGGCLVPRHCARVNA